MVILHEGCYFNSLFSLISPDPNFHFNANSDPDPDPDPDTDQDPDIEKFGEQISVQLYILLQWIRIRQNDADPIESASTTLV